MENSSLIPVVKWIRNGFASEEHVQYDKQAQAPQKQEKKDPNFELEGYDDEDSKIIRHARLCPRSPADEI